MSTNTASFTMDSALFAQLLTAVGRRNSFVSGGNQLIVQVPPVWTATIPDPSWQAIVDGQPNLTPQGQVDNITLQQYVELWLIYNVFGKVLDDDIHAEADTIKVAADVAAEAANEVIRAAAVVANLAAKNALVPTVTVSVV